MLFQILHLCGIELVVSSLLCDELFMTAGFHDAAVIDIHYFIAAHDSLKAVGYDKAGAALKHRVKTGLQSFLRLHVYA